MEGVQGVLAKDALCWVQNQVLYINGASMESYMPAVSIKAGEKQLISMGAYLCIFPDGIYFNTEKYSDNGYMGQENVKLQSKIEEIRLVDRAKCALIQYLSMTEEQAHHFIEKQAMDRCVTRRTVAEEILAE